ncbi:zinc finger protein 343-like [Echinops telfairi]|uniref:Zinc finger protein 343-like n=1 Tax=Echinops telfairi TaxID=9371 RepID=A0AC55CMH1_ECHTE|nr:zinc finger protein 343-like [Echinops telfairi]
MDTMKKLTKGLSSPDTDWRQEKKQKHHQILEPVTIQDVTVLFSEAEWETLSSEQKTLYRDVMLEIYRNLLSVGPTSQIYYSSRLFAFSCVQFLRQHVLQIFPDLCAKNHFHPADSSPGQPEHQGSDENCRTENTQGREREASKPLCGSTGERETARASSSSARGQSARPRKHNTVVGMKADSAPRGKNSVETDKGSKRLETSRFGVSTCRQDEPDCSLKPNFTNQKALSQEKPHVYSECCQGLTQKSYFLQQQRIHSDEKHDVFPPGWSLKSSLITHPRTRSGQKPCGCIECAQGFTCKPAVITHQRIHSGEKSYVCKECGQCFSWKSAFIRHQWAHSEEKPYTCKECARGFSRKSHLIRHERTHTGERPYVCQECGRGFSVR